MDVLGKALWDYETNYKDTFITYKIGTNVFKRSASYYFRSKLSDYGDCEKYIFKHCKGITLDVGCGTSSYHQLIDTDVIGIDNSKYMINISNKLGANCILGDIFTHKFNRKFKTIIFLGNNLGLGGNFTKTRFLIERLSKLLHENGIVYAVQKEISKDYEIIPIEIIYKELRNKIYWVSFNSEHIKHLFKEVFGYSQVIYRDNDNYVLMAKNLCT